MELYSRSKTVAATQYGQGHYPETAPGFSGVEVSCYSPVSQCISQLHRVGQAGSGVGPNATSTSPVTENA